VLIVLKNTSKKVVPAPIDVNTVQLQAAVNKDKTTEIKSSIDNIKVEDTTSTELDSVDKELNNL